MLSKKWMFGPPFERMNADTVRALELLDNYESSFSYVGQESLFQGSRIKPLLVMHGIIIREIETGPFYLSDPIQQRSNNPMVLQYHPGNYHQEEQMQRMFDMLDFIVESGYVIITAEEYFELTQ